MTIRPQTPWSSVGKMSLRRGISRLVVALVVAATYPCGAGAAIPELVRARVQAASVQLGAWQRLVRNGHIENIQQIERPHPYWGAMVFRGRLSTAGGDQLPVVLRLPNAEYQTPFARALAGHLVHHALLAVLGHPGASLPVAKVASPAEVRRAALERLTDIELPRKRWLLHTWSSREVMVVPDLAPHYRSAAASDLQDLPRSLRLAHALGDLLIGLKDGKAANVLVPTDHGEGASPRPASESAVGVMPDEAVRIDLDQYGPGAYVEWLNPLDQGAPLQAEPSVFWPPFLGHEHGHSSHAMQVPEELRAGIDALQRLKPNQLMGLLYETGIVRVPRDVAQYILARVTDVHQLGLSVAIDKLLREDPYYGNDGYGYPRSVQGYAWPKL